MKSIIIIGNSITAEIIYQLIKNDNKYKIECFSVDKKYIRSNTFKGLPVIDINKLKNLFDKSSTKIIIAMGYNNINIDRENMYKRIIKIGFDLESYIHPRANIFSDNIGKGCVFFPGVVVDPFCKIGNNCFLWSNATCAHHSIMSDNVWMASNSVISSNVNILKNSFIGVGSTIVNDVKVGESNIIGAGALITKDTSDNEVFLAKSGQRIPFSSIDYAKFNGY